MKYIMFALILITSLFASLIQAKPILYEFGGDIDYFIAANGLENPFSSDDKFSGTFTYDNEVAYSWNDGDTAVYRQTIGNFTMNFGGFEMDGGSATSYIRVEDNYRGEADLINIITPWLQSPNLDYLYKDVVGQFLYKGNNNIWNSPALPTRLDSPYDFSVNQFWLYGYYDLPTSQVARVGGEVQYLRPVSVPLPPILWLFCTALIGLFIFRTKN